MTKTGMRDSMRGGTGAHGRLGAWQQLWEARNLPAPYDKKWNTPAVCEET
ncbi:unnamed protein product [Staurois parvus]|uniref:DUF4113 domain-containing protein n=1 Tax=Staurois parvus TaxID=386267 RepID=A0ABN9AML4_9NEOB|nr:unnamed protein product [Staurois parvus]